MISIEVVLQGCVDIRQTGKQETEHSRKMLWYMYTGKEALTVVGSSSQDLLQPKQLGWIIALCKRTWERRQRQLVLQFTNLVNCQAQQILTVGLWGTAFESIQLTSPQVIQDLSQQQVAPLAAFSLLIQFVSYFIFTPPALGPGGLQQLPASLSHYCQNHVFLKGTHAPHCPISKPLRAPHCQF